jgi:hypothetical protein
MLSHHSTDTGDTNIEKPWRQAPPVIKKEKSVSTVGAGRGQKQKTLQHDPWVPTMRQPQRKKAPKKKNDETKKADTQQDSETAPSPGSKYISMPGVVYFDGQAFAKIRNGSIVVDPSPVEILQKVESRPITVHGEFFGAHLPYLYSIPAKF